MERKAKSDHVLGEIVEFINEHLIDINTGRPVSHEMVRNLLKQINFTGARLMSIHVTLVTLHSAIFSDLTCIKVNKHVEMNTIFQTTKLMLVKVLKN